MIVHTHESITTLENVLSWVDLSKSSFYYKSSVGKRGAKLSVCTFSQDGTLVNDTLVIEEIKGILSQEFCCYGYHNVTDELLEMGHIINHKKFYRLMKEQNLLLGKVISTNGKRQFVKHGEIEATRPMDYLCLDIKNVWVAGESINYFLLTILDVFTRVAIEQIFQKSIRKMDVINIFRRINNAFGIKGVTVRNNNGSQFISNDVKQFLRAAKANQGFTHIATPEENAYIEAFHSIVQKRLLIDLNFKAFMKPNLRFRHTGTGIIIVGCTLPWEQSP
jgi:hypothetical protein